MAETTVNTPIGPITVNHPDGASEEDILAFAQQRFQERSDRRAEIEASFEPATGLKSSGMPLLAIPGVGSIGTGDLENTFAGAGKFMVDQLRGARQLFGADNQEEIDNSRELDAPLLDSKAGLTGNILGGVATTAPLALVPGANTALGATVLGGAIGGVQPVATGESRLANTGIAAAGGLIGNRIGNTLSRAGRSGLNAAEQRVLDNADDLGFRTTAGTRTGNQSLQRAEAALESKAFTSGPIDAMKAHNQTVANRIVAESIGETSDVVDDAVLNRAFSRIGQVFDDTANSTPARTISREEGVRAGQFLNSLQDEFSGVSTRPVLRDPLVERYTNMVASGRATGPQLQSLTSKLGTKANTQLTSASGDRDLGRALLMVKENVDDLIMGGLPDAEQAAFLTAREQWRNLSRLTSRIGNINPSNGNVNLNSIASTLQRGDKFGFLRGNDNSALNRAAKFGQAFKPIVGNSGTATRSQGAADFVVGLPFNAASRGLFSDPVQAAIAGTGTVLGDVSEALGPLAGPRALSLFGANTANAQR